MVIQVAGLLIGLALEVYYDLTLMQYGYIMAGSGVAFLVFSGISIWLGAKGDEGISVIGILIASLVFGTSFCIGLGGFAADLIASLIGV